MEISTEIVFKVTLQMSSEELYEFFESVDQMHTDLIKNKIELGPYTPIFALKNALVSNLHNLREGSTDGSL